MESASASGGDKDDHPTDAKQQDHPHPSHTVQGVRLLPGHALVPGDHRQANWTGEDAGFGLILLSFIQGILSA